MQSEVAVSVQNLSVAYRDDGLFLAKEPVWAVKDVSFQIHKGETLGLVGESGSGKSTIAQVLMGLKVPDTGTIQLFGQNPYTLQKQALRQFRKRFRIIFQDPYASFNPKLSVGSQIAETMAVYGMHGNSKARTEKTAEWLTRVGLRADDAKRLPNTFSGGQRQRIAIARALACEPDFLVCDECVSSLDVSLQRDILDLLLQLQSQLNMSMLFISHDPATVHFMCENVLVLKDGKSMEYGPTPQVWENPQSAYTKTLLQSIL
jgi:peptide/nickel transport system ATP-binding protein